MLNQNVINDLSWFFSLFKSSPIVIIGGIFTIYFAVQKLTKKVSVSFSMSSNRFYDQHIPALVLSNKRDNVIAIESIFVKVNSKYRIKLKSFDSPLVLKAHDTLKVDLPKYSAIYHDEGEFKFDFFDNLNFYINTISGVVIHCDIESSVAPQLDSGMTSVNTIIYEGLILTRRYAFVFTYYEEKTKKNLIIDITGFMDGDNPFSFNYININDMTNGNFKKILIDHGVHDYLDNYHLVKVKQNLQTETVLFKHQVEKEIKADN
ncbi:hypothetical protein IB231_04530 [Pantoea sp. PNT02]|uniref:hypothetical protein n=1 Tax=Pantoea sp. PNT02 TaxID=2769261 RepID=UPI001781DF93|nr:hypothetical protein [Pantoea sp. PNT02]MBD9642893.1 hypothetical protein [Pantoea sp. PNT02]